MDDVINVPENDFTIRAFINNPQGSHSGCWLGFPTTPEELLTSLEVTGAENGRIIVTEYRTNNHGYLDNKLPNILLPGDLNELNYLAVRLSELDGGQRDVFDAAVVVEAGYHGSIADYINTIENLDSYVLQPAFSTAQYGELLVNQARDEHAEVVARLKKSDNYADRAFFEYFDVLETVYDVEKYGELMVSMEGGVFTERGYLVYCGGTEIYTGIDDIPDKYIVYPFSDKKLLLRVENTDLTRLLVKMHALGGDYKGDIEHELLTLMNNQSADFLLLMNSASMYLTRAVSAYLEDSTAHDMFLMAAVNPEAKAFALHINGGSDRHGDGIFGDIAELNIVELSKNIQQNTINFTNMDAVLSDGTRHVFTLEEWAALPRIERSKVCIQTRHYDPVDLQAINSLLTVRHQENKIYNKTVEPESFLSDFNLDYMRSAVNQQANMLRISQSVARDIIKSGDMPVYRLLPEGSHKLTEADVISSNNLWYQDYREFAIKSDDVDRLEHWADNQVMMLHGSHEDIESSTSVAKTITATLPELLEIMEPQHRQDQSLIKDAIWGLANYAAETTELRIDGWETIVQSARSIVEQLVPFWGLDEESCNSDDVNAFLEAFDDIVQAAKYDPYRADSSDISVKNAVISGLHRHALELLYSAGLEDIEMVDGIVALMTQISEFWNETEPITIEAIADIRAEINRLENTELNEVYSDNQQPACDGFPATNTLTNNNDKPSVIDRITSSRVENETLPDKTKPEKTSKRQDHEL